MRQVLSVSIFLFIIQFFKTNGFEYVSNETPYCYQDRDDIPECEAFHNEFCNQIACPTIEDCGGNLDIEQQIVANLTVHGCCPGCVTYLDENDDCDPRAKLEKCKEGFECNVRTRKCGVHESPKTKCLVEYVTRNKLRQRAGKKEPFIYQGIKSRVPVDFLYFSDTMELPQCDPATGNYKIKQCMGGKCYCVDDRTGDQIFGLTQQSDAENVTCQCSHDLYRRMIIGNREYDDKSSGICSPFLKAPDENTRKEIRKANIEFYSQIHEHCDSSGNYEELQCKNNTCFCVDPATGKPTSKSVLFGALRTLPCFDVELAREKGYDSEKYYVRECERQLLLPNKHVQYFDAKGTRIIEMTSISCQYDGNFAQKQCDQSVCMCTNLKGVTLKSYRKDKSSDTSSMRCNCARQEMEKEVNQMHYDLLQCDQEGNFIPSQCVEQNSKCFCYDDNGIRISREFTPEQVLKFADEQKAAGNGEITQLKLCQQMKEALCEELSAAYSIAKIVK